MKPKFKGGIIIAGDPIPGVDVSLEQVPGGVRGIATESECERLGGYIVKKEGKTFCALRKKAETKQNN